MADVTFDIDFGDGFSIHKSNNTTASFHRLTSDQFDALVDAFPTIYDVRTLQTDGRFGAPKTFRTTDIEFGGLTVSIFADVVAAVDDAQMSLNI